MGTVVVMGANLLSRLEATYVSPENSSFGHTLNPRHTVICRDFWLYPTNDSFKRMVEKAYKGKQIKYEWAKNPRLFKLGDHIIYAWVWLEEK